jgi:hypothetical protein
MNRYLKKRIDVLTDIVFWGVILFVAYLAGQMQPSSGSPQTGKFRTAKFLKKIE